LPFVLSYALIHGDVFLEAFTPKYFIEDATIRQLMSRITVSGTPDPAYLKMDRSHFTVRKKSGEQMEKDIFEMKPMTRDEVIKKFIRVCDFKGVAASQRDQALDTWGNLMKAKDIGEPIRQLAKFGNPMPL
jgi:2-methylcitrate dehydratase PrpD